MGQSANTPATPAKPDSRHPIFRLALAGFGIVAMVATGSSLVAAWNKDLPHLVVVALWALPFFALGTVCLLMGAAARIRPIEQDEMDPCTLNFSSDGPRSGLFKPERHWETLVHWVLYVWLGVCLLVFGRSVSGAILPGSPSVPPWAWAIPASAIPVIIWLRQRHRFHRRWGRCQLRLLRPPERGQPFAGSIEAQTRFRPTQDFHLLLTCHPVGAEGEDWPAEWTAEQTVGRDQMQTTKGGSRIPFQFSSLHPTTYRPEPAPCRRWRLCLRTQLAGQNYTESFCGPLPNNPLKPSPNTP